MPRFHCPTVAALPVLALIVVFGCGGGGSSKSTATSAAIVATTGATATTGTVTGTTSGTPVEMPPLVLTPLGEDSVDFTITPPTARYDSIRGTGETYGVVTVHQIQWSDGHWLLEAAGQLDEAVEKENRACHHGVLFEIGGSAPLAVGQTYHIDGGGPNSYQEWDYPIHGLVSGNNRAYKATDGTVEVVALENGRATLRLTGGTFLDNHVPVASVAVSGTLSGTLTVETVAPPPTSTSSTTATSAMTDSTDTAGNITATTGTVTTTAGGTSATTAAGNTTSTLTGT